MEQKPKKRKKGLIIGIIIAVIVIGIIGAAVEGGDSDKSDSRDGATSGDGKYVQGDTMEYSELKVTIDEIDADFTDYDNSYGINTPADGNKYIKLTLTGVNEGDDDAMLSYTDFNCYADGAQVDQEYLNDDATDLEMLTLSSGRKGTINIYFEVPKDATEIEVEWEANMLSDKKMIIKVL